MRHRLTGQAAALLLLLTGCGGGTADGSTTDAHLPEEGACRVLEPADIAQPDNSSEVVPCSAEHTAETFAVWTFPPELNGESYDSPELGRHVYRTCTSEFQKHLGGDESSVMRSLLTWAWFRPSEPEWDEGARWFRCDVVSGNEDSKRLRPLPESTKGLLAGRPDDRWMTCAAGETVADSEKVPCTKSHDWRAVTTIQVGQEGDPYPGDRVVEVQTRDFCSDSVGAWLNYPVDYEFGYTYFREAEWKAGNRRSICWARTDQ